MNATLEPDTAPRETWRAVSPTPPPQDREIRIVANIVDRDEWSTSVEPYQGRARWDERSQDWLDERGMSIRGFYESELVILEWSDANTCREFILKGKGRLIRLAPRRQPIAELPAPAWHTTDPYRGPYEVEFRQWLDGMTSQELFDLLKEHERFSRAFVGLADFGDDEHGVWTIWEVAKSGQLGRELSNRDQSAAYDAMKQVEDRIQSWLLMRYKNELEKRSQAAVKAASTRRGRSRHDEASRRVAL